MAVGLYRNPTDDALYVRLHNSEPEITASVGVYGEDVSASQALLELSVRARKAKPRAGNKTTFPPPSFLERKAKEIQSLGKPVAGSPASIENISEQMRHADVRMTELHGIKSGVDCGSPNPSPCLVSREKSVDYGKENPSRARNKTELFGSSSSSSFEIREEEEDIAGVHENAAPPDWYLAREANPLVKIIKRFIQRFGESGGPSELIIGKLRAEHGEHEAGNIMQNAFAKRFAYERDHCHRGTPAPWLFIAEEPPRGFIP